MFDTVEKYRSVVKVLLGIIALSFVTFGVHTCTRSGQDYITQIGDKKISNNDIRSFIQKNNLSGNNEIRTKVFESLISQTYLIQGMQKEGATLPPESIKAMLVNIPIFQDEKGQFSQAKFNEYLANTNQSEADFITQSTQQFLLQSAQDLIMSGNLTTDSQIDTFTQIYSSIRKVQSLGFPIEQYLNKVEISEEKLKAFYEQNKQQYVEPQAIKISYVVANPQILMAEQKISTEEIQHYFEINKQAAPQREVSHILLAFPANADSAIKEKIRLQALDLLKEVKAQPQNFAAFAQRYSQDPGSAKNGGSLGMVEKNGQLVPSFEETAFSLGNNQISNLVESQYGYHIIKASNIMNHKNMQEDSVAIQNILKLDKAKKIFAQIEENMAEAAFNSPNSLDAVAKIDKSLKINQINHWSTKSDLEKQGFAQPIIEALFSDDLLNQKVNSDVIKADGSDFVVRVNDVRPARNLSFDEIKEKVITDYRLASAQKLAQDAAASTLVKLEKGEATDQLNWTVEEPVTLLAAKQLLPENEFQSFLVAKPQQNKPVYIQVHGFPEATIIRINAIENPKKDENERLMAMQQLIQLQAADNSNSYLNFLKKNISSKEGLQKIEE